MCSSPTSSVTATALPSPFLRKAAILSFLPALPLCITHGALSADAVPAVGLVPLFFSAGVSLFLLIRASQSRRRGKGKQRAESGVSDPEGLFGRGTDAGEPESVEEGGPSGLSGIEPDVEERDETEDEGEGASVLTHRIFVFVVDAILAAALMVVLVFTWIGTGRARDKSPQLAMLAAYSTMPLLVNFLIHLYLAAREFVAGLAIPGLVEYTAWRVVPADCPHCGNRLRPDSFPPIPWYETVERPKVSLSQIKFPTVPRPSLPSFRAPRFAALKGPREWKVPNWMRGRSQEYASLFVDEEQSERDRYRDDPDGPFGEPSGTTTVVATGSADPAPVVEEVVVGKKDKKGKSGSGALLGEDVTSWS
ncbi:hypothetical protein C8A03DRAFT_17642 [Achaetomium macrosporum]|uniref:Uncharacterized protein n=1 Tax=Achaetomium macrosporum TaxID=79813 RepID=A0AAN7C733_9PEZI|nr:hypothetical protein C8A03DRAFT_17642 [Achaetomium macrosporum]